MKPARGDTYDQQLAILRDPQAFAHSMTENVFLLDFDHVFQSGRPRQSWANRDEALRIAEQRAGTPDAARAIGVAWDLSNNLALDLQSLGIQMGVVLEQLRQALIACLDHIDQKEREEGDRDGDQVARLRALVPAAAPVEVAS